MNSTNKNVHSKLLNQITVLITRYILKDTKLKTTLFATRITRQKYPLPHPQVIIMTHTSAAPGMKVFIMQIAKITEEVGLCGSGR